MQKKNIAHTKNSSEKNTFLMINQALTKKDFPSLKVLNEKIYLSNNNNFRLLNIFGKMIERTLTDQDPFFMESLLVSYKLYIDSITKFSTTNAKSIHKPYV